MEPQPSQPVERFWVRDASVMRALSHPARYSILEHLLTGASGTATELGKRVGLTPSATSYHLRELAKVGMIEQAPSRGDGRERVWQTSKRGLNVETGPDATDDERLAERDLTAMFLEREHAHSIEWLDRARSEPHEWYVASMLTEMHPLVTSEELRALNDQVLALFEQYSRASRPVPPPDARKVTIVYRSYPRKED